ncbi:nuclear factor erythroid 2-related factor 2b isoform X3 [Pimephales promelas]|nr:nuclear factor erythroid 2-related factor 2b isoform X3 [Pimephales promelas]KAG1942382.1 transcription factor NF-E2 45 kDa subunit [Pimephales promelas]KAG1942384.1 transcription factor NF-E2 45 kDa subunit [Pimephales promelas]
MRARDRELKRERELERIMQRLQKLDKETGEFLPSPSSVNSQAVPFSETLPATVSTQHSPVTQNPLLSALLFSKSQKLPSQEQAFSELLSLPDLQYYLDVLESEGSSLPLEDITEICHHHLPEPQRENPTDELCGISEVTQIISDSYEVAQPLSCMPSDPLEVLETCIETFSDPGNLTPSPSNTIYSCSTPKNQGILTKCQTNSSDSTLSEFCPDINTYTINTSTVSEPEQLNGARERNAPQMLSQFGGRHILLGFDDSASVSSVDLETSLYAVDTLSNGQSEKDELESIQSDYSDLLPLSLHSETVEAAIYESAMCAHSQHQTQNESTPENSQKEPQSNFTTANRAAGVRRACRDEQRARALGLPISVHDIINLPVEAFNEAIGSCKLNNAQHALIRDIRRRGKNKMAAQSCRKRKLNSLVDLEDEIEVLKREKDKSKEEKERNTRDLRETKEKLKNLYNEVFGQLRDEHGNSYSPKEYKLQHSTDGTFYLLPRSTANKKNSLSEDLATAV